MSAIAVLLVLTGLFDVLYWVLYFFGATQVQENEVYRAFENAFPMADGWLAFACFLGAYGLWARKEWGVLFSAMAGSCLIYLGCLDVLFNLNNRIYQEVMSPQLALEIFINITSFLIGIAAIVIPWKRRRAW